MSDTDSIASLIITVRQKRVMLDSDLAAIYGVTTKRFNEQVKRNRDRFPEDFMFQLTAEEFEALRSQIATSNEGRGGRRYAPFVFTEHGALMAANILNSSRAVQTSIAVVRALSACVDWRFLSSRWLAKWMSWKVGEYHFPDTGYSYNALCPPARKS